MSNHSKKFLFIVIIDKANLILNNILQISLLGFNVVIDANLLDN